MKIIKNITPNDVIVLGEEINTQLFRSTNFNAYHEYAIMVSKYQDIYTAYPIWFYPEIIESLPKTQLYSFYTSLLDFKNSFESHHSS